MQLRNFLPVLYVVDVLLIMAHFAWGSTIHEFNLDKETNLPTWFAGFQLILLALASFVCFLEERVRGLGSRGAPWSIVSLIFLYMSYDELTVFHEGFLRDEFRSLFAPDSLWLSVMPWQVIFAPLYFFLLTLILWICWSRFYSSKKAVYYSLSGLGLWCAALLGEAMAKPVFMQYGLYHLQVAIEEGCELFGASLLIAAVLQYQTLLSGGMVTVVYRSPRLVLMLSTLCTLVLGAVVALISVSNAGWLYQKNGNLLLKDKNYNGAIIAYTKALDENSGGSKLFKNIAYAHYKLKNYEQALFFYDKALAISPADARLWRDKGITLYRLDRLEDAISAYQQSVKHNPQNISAWTDLALTFEKYGDLTGAEEAYKKVITLNPGNKKAQNFLRLQTDKK